MSASAGSPDSLSRLLEERFSVAKAIPVGRGALGLAAVLRCWRGVRSTCRVAMPGAICHEVVLAVLASGCEPVFCDVDVVDGLVKEKEWARARALGADAAIVVHLYGNPSRTNSVRATFPAPNCLLIDDAAQALGSQSQDGFAGAEGDVGLLSFGLTKHIHVGNAAVLFKSIEFAAEVGSYLNGLSPRPYVMSATLTHSFRWRLERARARLREKGEEAATEFAGMLEGMEPVLNVPLNADVDTKVATALADYHAAAEARIDKAKLWSSSLAGSGFEPVGMGAGCVPWRFVCRIPGLDWPTQYHLAEMLRATGMHVSNWYLPAHWFVGERASTLPGVEKLSREVFQFWVDESVSHESIVRDAAIVRRKVSCVL